METLKILKASGLPVHFTRFSALDKYFRSNGSPSLHIVVTGNLIELAKTFPDLRYPGIDKIDAALQRDGGPPLYFQCVEGSEGFDPQSFNVLNLLYDPFRDCFLDPLGIYPRLRNKSLEPPSNGDGGWIPDAAILLSRYMYVLDFSGQGSSVPSYTPAAMAPESQRDLLLQILTGKNAASGLRLLQESGFMAVHWPELAAMRDVTHSKEYHPEGDAWDHTLETFRYRKNTDIAVSLALLLHDAGKPHAETQEGRRFDKHAEIGTEIAESFLRRLEFFSPIIRDVLFLVKNHMLPGALKTLPVYRVERTMESDLFPALLEVYRCDLSSTFRGPDGYYEACKLYRAFLKHRKNPFRTSDGKKIQRLREYVER
jgi:poly(A) polymerase